MLVRFSKKNIKSFKTHIFCHYEKQIKPTTFSFIFENDCKTCALQFLLKSLGKKVGKPTLVLFFLIFNIAYFQKNFFQVFFISFSFDLSQFFCCLFVFFCQLSIDSVT
jgi:hypothetical protein